MKSENTTVRALRALPSLYDASPRQLVRLVSLVDEVRVPAGTMLTREGGIGREAFLILEGTAEVTIGGRQVATVGRGEFVGEMAMIETGIRTATARALGPMRLLVVGPKAWASFTSEPPVARTIAAQLARRLRSAG